MKTSLILLCLFLMAHGVRAVEEAKPAGGMSAGMKAVAAGHWAYQAVREPAVPQVPENQWSDHPVDHFVLEQLQKAGLSPSPPADRRTLLRRVYFDLIGLPPTPAEVADFVADESPDAFERRVDDLLSRPQYGERWGRHWLDVARYADTRGATRQRQTPLNPHAWTYRDYVINAFNDDKPYDQFIWEQLAADQLGGDDSGASLAALGFLTQGDQFRGNRQDIINDQIDVVTKGFLGLTVTCARCHDHSFDPIPQADYYSLHGIFNSSVEPATKPAVILPVKSGSEDDYRQKREAIVRDGRTRLVAATDRAASIFNRQAGTFIKLAGMKPQSPEFYSFVRENRLDGRMVQELLRILRQKMNVRRGQPPHPVLSGLKALMAVKPEDFGTGFPAWSRRWVEGRPGRPSNAAVREAFRNSSPENLGEALDVYASVFARADDAWRRESGRWKKSGNGGIFPGLEDRELESVRTAVLDPQIFRNGELNQNQRNWPRTIQYLLSAVQAELARLDVSHAGAPGLANVLEDVGRPRDSAVFLRGEVQNPGKVVPRQFLEVLAGPERQPFTQGSGRLGLAESIASPDNPLTARVLVNRVWQHHFGEGFVSTPDDLGVMSGAPAHPALLDYLAARFMREGWSIKKLHRTILLSKTWQQASVSDPVKAGVDPFNRLLWRQNTRRLDFEAMRDSLLFMGGQLDLTMGGQPVNIESEPYSQRRSIYGYIDRNETAEFMRHFDVANASLPTGKRSQTIVPQQALFRMNSLLVIEQARNIMVRDEIENCSSDQERVEQLYAVIFQRKPSIKELELAEIYLAGQPAAPDADSADAVGAQTQQQRKRLARAQQIRKERMARRQMMNPRNEAAAAKEAVRDPAADRVDRSPLTPWEKYAHALLMTAGAAYVH